MILFLSLLFDRTEPARYNVLELLPLGAIQAIAQFPEIVHFPPTVSAPLTACHIDNEVAVLFSVVYPLIQSVVVACAIREAVDFALGNESCVAADPRLVGV